LGISIAPFEQMSASGGTSLDLPAPGVRENAHARSQRLAAAGVSTVTFARKRFKATKVARRAVDDEFMKRASIAIPVLASLFVLWAPSGSFAQSTGSARSAHAIAAMCAPADEYFGPLKLSVLGIRNSIVQTNLRLDRAGLDTGDTMQNLGLVEASVREWETKYPGDSWLPNIVYSLHHVYRKLRTNEAMLHSVDVATWLMQKYPRSNEAREVRSEFASAVASEQEPNTR